MVQNVWRNLLLAFMEHKGYSRYQGQSLRWSLSFFKIAWALNVLKISMERAELNPTTQTAHSLTSFFTTKLCVPREHVKNSVSVKVLLTNELMRANVKPLVLLDLYGFPVCDKVCLAVAR